MKKKVRWDAQRTHYCFVCGKWIGSWSQRSVQLKLHNGTKVTCCGERHCRHVIAVKDYAKIKNKDAFIGLVKTITKQIDCHEESIRILKVLRDVALRDGAMLGLDIEQLIKEQEDEESKGA